MQIDFHHAATYVATRLAGFSHQDARTVAHASQYVDDATTDGPLTFSSGERYVRVTSAHKTFDIGINSDHADNRLVWVPFHFLPGNDAPPAGSDPADGFAYRMMCKPDSAVARAMMRDCVERQAMAFGLHRFGIALHTYVDTWAHQQFVGMVCKLNQLDELRIEPDPAYAETEIYRDLTSGMTKIKVHIASYLPVGHATALTCPDMPFLKWSFVRGNGETVHRDNPSDFLAATEGMFNMARRYVAKDFSLPDADMPAADRALIDKLLRGTILIDGEDRHPIWIEAIRQGLFSFGPAEVSYVDQGPDSWKMQALGEDPDDEDGVTFVFTEKFLGSDWKHFHDAVQHHRLFVLHDLLPKVGLCAS